MDAVWPYLAAIIPSVAVSILFYFLIKSMLEGDRRERLAQRRFEDEEDRHHAAEASRRAASTGSGELPTASAAGGQDARTDDPGDLPAKPPANS
jgi:hypothetical protein